MTHDLGRSRHLLAALVAKQAVWYHRFSTEDRWTDMPVKNGAIIYHAELPSSNTETNSNILLQCLEA